MKTSYGVVWREGGGQVVAGKLELLPRGLRFEGREGTCEIPYGQLAGVRIGRSNGERLDGRPTVILERRGADLVTISTVAQSNLIGEIAERLAELRLGVRTERRVAVVLPLRAGSRDAVRALLQSGPPFDPEAVEGLERHEVFLTDGEAVFVFEAGPETGAFVDLLAKPELWASVGAWRDHVSGPPRIAEDVFSWQRPDEDDDVFYLATPGPGDSDGGDIY
jgi:hypothetical protein